MQRTLEINPVEPAPLSLRHATGVDLELDLTFVTLAGDPVDATSYYPQLVLIPRSSNRAYGYDIEMVSPTLGVGHVSVPGINFNDRRDMTLEVYRRDAQGVPKGLLAKGVLRIEADGYTSMGPLGPMTIPTVEGPQGATGPQGQRGSIWLTGNGNPAITSGVNPGDMYLDNVTGNVWSWDGASWSLR